MKKTFRDEWELLQGINKRDKYAFEQFHSCTIITAFLIALNIVKNKLDAEEIVQDAFLKVLQSNTQFDSLQHAKNYLYRVTKNLSINFKKYPGRLRWQSLPEEFANIRDDTDIEATIAEAEVWKEVRAQIRKLPEKQQSMFKLMDEGKTTSEIALLINKNDQYVRNRKADIIKLLKSVLKGKI
jgi:RNA polymerase sigma-70 factor (ECF subfamily)